MRFITLLVILLLLVLGGAGWWAWQHDALPAWVLSLTNQGVKLQESIHTSSPLRGPLAPISTALTADGIVRETNGERTASSRPALKRNSILDKAAAAKIDDMFAQQYFEHVSPQGKGPGDVVTAAGYTYITVGENLALGNFDGDEALVQAWMDSPGHRANILNPDFLEIGVAVRRGTFEGQNTWLAVQEFGTARSACPIPSSSGAKEIETAKTALSRLETDLANLKKAIDAKTKEYKQHPSEETQAEIQALADEYNRQVAIYNAKQTQLQKDITAYNSQIKAANTCITTYTS